MDAVTGGVLPEDVGAAPGDVDVFPGRLVLLLKPCQMSTQLLSTIPLLGQLVPQRYCCLEASMLQLGTRLSLFTFLNRYPCQLPLQTPTVDLP